ncbi:unnamed protein product, partial [Brassica rapa subsp. trilocularis]
GSSEDHKPRKKKCSGDGTDAHAPAVRWSRSDFSLLSCSLSNLLLTKTDSFS